jgi:hypothetical protein
MTLTELIEAVRDAEEYAKSMAISTDAIHVMARGIDGAKRDVSDIYSLIGTKKMVVIDTEQ